MTEPIEQPLSSRRRAIARAVKRSLGSTAQLTCGARADLSEIVRLRRRYGESFKAKLGASLTPLAFVARAVCRALLEDPFMNATIDEERGVYVRYPAVNLGIAIDDPGGLVVGCIPDAHLLKTPALAIGIAELAQKVRSGKAGLRDVSGSTFTISNTGSRGSVFDTPILNYPEVGILAFTALERRLVPLASDGDDILTGAEVRVGVEWSSLLCLTYDHRLVDGADAARFLGSVNSALATTAFEDEIADAVGVSVP